MKKGYLISCLTAVLFLFNDCARNPVTGKSQLVFMTEAQEISMGQQADPEIVAQYGLYNDKALQDFITQKGNEMVAVSHRNNIKYEFKILDSDVLNAFALPGGYVYFTRGIMAYLNNDAQFAGVLGHEIGHVAARHSVEQQRNAMLGQIGLIAGVVLAPNLAQYAETASQGLGLLLLKFGRDAERESDRLGVEYSSKIGYDAQQMAGFFLTLKREQEVGGSSGLPEFMSTHPDPGNRYETVLQLASEWKQKLNLSNPKTNRDTYLKRIDGIIYGIDPKQGFVENGIFYQPVLKFQFPIPQDWAFQNTPQRVQMATKDGKAMMMLTLAQGRTLQGAADSVLQQYGLQLVDARQVSVNGLNAIAMLADQKPQQQQQQQQQQQPAVRTLSYIIQHGGYFYHMLGVSLAADFNAYAPYFTNSMQNFRQLTDPAKLNKMPERIRIKAVSQSGTLQQALRFYKVPDNRLEELAILNGMHLNDQVTKGTMIKVIEQ